MKYTILLAVVWLIAGCAYQYINQLQIGMTEKEVRDMMIVEGKVVAGAVADDGSEIKVYLYEFFDEKYVLGFRNGRLVLWQRAPGINTHELIAKQLGDQLSRTLR